MCFIFIRFVFPFFSLLFNGKDWSHTSHAAFVIWLTRWLIMNQHSIISLSKTVLSLFKLCLLHIIVCLHDYFAIFHDGALLFHLLHEAVVAHQPLIHFLLLISFIILIHHILWCSLRNGNGSDNFDIFDIFIEYIEHASLFLYGSTSLKVILIILLLSLKLLISLMLHFLLYLILQPTQYWYFSIESIRVTLLPLLLLVFGVWKVDFEDFDLWFILE